MPVALKLVNLVALSTFLALICSLATLPGAAVAEPIAHGKLARNFGRAHEAIAMRKRTSSSSTSTQKCKPRPTSVTANSTSTVKASTTSSSTHSSTHSTTHSTTKTSSTPSSTPQSSGGGSVSTSGGSTGSSAFRGKLGLSWTEDPSFLSNFVTNDVGAIYNWNPSSPVDASKYGIQYMPMLWSPGRAPAFQAVANKLENEWYIGYNECNEPGQCNTDPATAAANWIQVMEPLHQKGKKLACPSTSSNPNGLTWTQNFFSACNGQCHCDAIPLHWYDTSFAKLQAYVQLWHTTFPDYKLWITEFAFQNFNGGGQLDLGTIESNMRQAIAWLDSQDYVDLYIAFGWDPVPGGGVNPLNALMTESHTPSELGKIFLHQA